MELKKSRSFFQSLWQIFKKATERYWWGLLLGGLAGACVTKYRKNFDSHPGNFRAFLDPLLSFFQVVPTGMEVGRTPCFEVRPEKEEEGMMVPCEAQPCPLVHANIIA